MNIVDKKILRFFCERLLDCGAISEWFFNGLYHVRVDSKQYYLVREGSSVKFFLEKEF